ncbi:MAG: tRNA pseudouridine55 synthase [Halioglobus sp.]|jgi:tRNA pseudouridine55 synthase
MARRGRGRPIDGILLLDKPLGDSSNRALQQAKRLFFAAKAGHTGSLDPLASGVLPLCFGEATKFSQFLLDADKAYASTFLLGKTTASGDSEGELLDEQDASYISKEDVELALEAFRGEIEQIPSMFSAIKHKGQPLYKLARQGKEVERKVRRVTIHRLELKAFRSGPHPEVDVELECTKGTYVRSVAEDLGKALGCGAHVIALRRTRSGPFGIDDCITMPALEALKGDGLEADMDALLLPSDAALGAIPLVELSESSGFYMRQGQPVLVPNAPGSGMVRIALQTGEFLGIGEMLDDGRVAPRRLIVTNG